MKCNRRLYASTALSCALASLGVAASFGAAWAQDSGAIETVVVLGVRGAEQKAIDTKRNSTSIIDSIAAEDIGKLPDTTISDSLQRITGVQIDRSAGEGSGVNIRGLPEVSTMLNGEAFLTTSNIVGVQPNFGDIPSSLFSGADVVKSPTASLLNSGITGTIDLKTRHPLDMPQGWTLSGSLQGVHGTKSNKYEPDFNGLVNYNGGHWGAMLAVTYSDITLENSTNGMDQYGGELFAEQGGSCNGCTGAYNGFVTGWNGATIPSAMNYNSSTGSVDVNSDGDSTDAFYGTENAIALQREIERQRIGVNASIQGELGYGLRVSGDFFYTFQKQYNRQVGYQLNSSSWLGATFIPTVSRDTGVKVYGGWNSGSSTDNQYEFYTTQVYTKYIGDMETYSEDDVTTSSSRNYNLQLAYDNGGNFTAEVRGIYADARELLMQSYIQFALTDGAQWNSGSTTYAGLNGSYTYNPYGLAANTYPVVIDMRGENMKLTLPTALQSALSNVDAYALKTVSSEGNHDRSSGMKVFRADGHYKFGESGVKFDFGIRESFRAAQNTGFNLVAPMYGGEAAYNADGSVNSTGCYVRWKAADTLLNSSNALGCYAVNSSGEYLRANTMAGYTPTEMPSAVSNYVKTYKNVAGVKGVTMYNIAPKAMDNVMKFQNSLYPGNIRDIDPASTWRVSVSQTSGYFQSSFDGDLAFPGNVRLPFDFNAGLRVTETWLGVDQHKVDTTSTVKDTSYGRTSGDLGITHTDRTFTDYLPAVNFSLDVFDNLKFRAAYSRNMQLLDLSQWGGALSLNYGLASSTSNIYAVLGGSQNGNPDLDPWRSSNYDMSFEYYYGKSSMVSLALFYIDVDSFIYTGSTNRCDLADMDGVVRRCAAVSGPIQGNGKNLKGVEIADKQAFDFLPGFWGNFGSEVNMTFSPSNSGEMDLSGAAIPFADNSKWQGNLILWYQDDLFQARIAGNYRSKRAVSSNIGGIQGFEQYQKSTFYLDASASYDFMSNMTVYLQGSNLLGEKEHYYYVWTDQKGDTTQFEPRITLGVRARF